MVLQVELPPLTNKNLDEPHAEQFVFAPSVHLKQSEWHDLQRIPDG